MKRLCLTILALLLLLSSLPLITAAEEVMITASVDDVTDEIVISWDPLSIPEGYALSGVRDASLNFYTLTASAEGTATFVFSCAEDGEYAFEAVFVTETFDSLYVPFALTVTTVTKPTAPIEILDILWDDTYHHLTITWVPQEELTINSIQVNGETVFIFDKSGSVRNIEIPDLPYGRFFVTYNCTGEDGDFTYTDETHSFIVYGGDIVTKLYVSPDENGAPLVQVYDDKTTPLSGVTVHLITDAGEQVLMTDENGRAVFEGEYKDVKQVYSEDLQTEIALYKGQTVQVEHTTTVPSTSATTPATSRPPKTTKPATGTSRPETQPTTTQTYYVGAGTTGAEENMVMLNAILDEGAMAAFGLAGSEFDTGARLLISREVYNRLAEQGNGLPVMMSVFSHSRTLENKDMFAVLNQQPEPYDKSTAYSYVIELGIVFWDAENQTAVKAMNLPYDSYVVRLPRPKNTEEHNRFYVLDMSGDTVGDYVEAVAEPEYVQVTLTNMNAVALVACEATVSQSNWRVHPLVYVFFILGGLLLLVAAAMIYFFFLYRPQTADGPAKQVVYDFTDEIEDEAADTADFSDEIPFDNMPEMDDLGDDIPEEDIEESISLGDLFNRRDK